MSNIRGADGQIAGKSKVIRKHAYGAIPVTPPEAEEEEEKSGNMMRNVSSNLST